MSEVDPSIAELVERVRGADSALFITGAGISADSGLPTYRGIGGLYETDATEEGLPIELALSGHMMNVDPTVVWKHISQLESAYRGAKHNRGHEVLAELESVVPRVWVLTQNVDGFHRDAGTTNLIEIHGNVRELMCTRCVWRDSVFDYSGLQMPPRCPDCDGLIRPDVVLFGEMLPAEAVAAMYRELSAGFDLVVSIGTSSLFPYIAEPVAAAAAAGIPTAEINPGQSAVSGIVDLRIRARAKDALEALWSLLAGGVGSD